MFEDMFSFVSQGVISLPKEDVINVQPDSDAEELLDVFYWLTGKDGTKRVDVLLEVMEFDNLEDAQVWALTDLPDFMAAVNNDIDSTESLLGEMHEMLGAASERLAAAEAIMNGPPKPEPKVKKVKKKDKAKK